MEKHNERSLDFVRLVGVHLRDARVAQGLSQAEVARKMGLTATAVSNYETGLSEMPLRRLAEMAEALGVTVESLVALPDSPGGERTKVYRGADALVVVLESESYDWTAIQVLVHPGDAITTRRVLEAAKCKHDVPRLTAAQVQALNATKQEPPH